MESQHENIEKYLLGELTPDELIIFESAIKSDHKLAESVAKHREMIERLNVLRLRHKVKSVITSKNRKTNFFSGNLNLLAIAASILFLILTAWFLFLSLNKSHDVTIKQDVTVQFQNPILGDSTKQLSIANSIDTNRIQTKATKDAESNKSIQYLTLANVFLILPSQIFTRDADDQSDHSDNNPFKLALEAFNNKHYHLSLDQLQLMKINNNDEDALLLRAHTYFQLKKFENAAKDFEALQNSFQFKHEARWNYLLCQLSQGKSELANKLLGEMISEKDFPYQEKAIELKSKLNF